MDKLRKPRQGEMASWRRRRMIYDRHQAGETYVAIAHDLGVCYTRAKDLSDQWKRILKGYEHYLAYPSEYDTADKPRFDAKRTREYVALLDRLVAAGLLGDHRYSAEYGYA